MCPIPFSLGNTFNVQGDPNQNLKFVLAITLKLCTHCTLKVAFYLPKKMVLDTLYFVLT